MMFILAIVVGQSCFAVDLSPSHWNSAERRRAEQLERQLYPAQPALVQGSSGLVAATLSPIAIQAGVETLRQGGTAADAAVTVALTQVTTALGSYVSDAGVLQLLYYDARTGQVLSLNAPWGTYREETDPKSIPRDDMGPLSFAFKGQPTSGAEGRKTLVPGFMAGLQAMHDRLGRLPWGTLFEPSIWYAQHGVRVTPLLAYYFATRKQILERTPEGRAFLRQADNPILPAIGSLFVQQDLAHTLQQVALHGARYMYTGAWGQAYVRAVQRAGGKVTLTDMRSYQPIWETALRTTVFGSTVVVPGATNLMSVRLLEALNLAEAMRLDRQGPYNQDPRTLEAITMIARMVSYAPILRQAEREAGLPDSLEARLSKPYAQALAVLLANPETLGETRAAPPTTDRHSDAIVIVDRWGDIAAMTHSINTVLWGSTGIVVGGIPVADVAGQQQALLQTLKPGALVPSDMVPVIVLTGGKPTLALSSIGVSLFPETLRLLVSLLGQHVDPTTALASPPLLIDLARPPPGDSLLLGPVPIPQGAYSPAFLASLRSLGLVPMPRTRDQVAGLRGTVVMSLRDEHGSGWESPVVPGVSDRAAGLGAVTPPESPSGPFRAHRISISSRPIE